MAKRKVRDGARTSGSRAQNDANGAVSGKRPTAKRQLEPGRRRKPRKASEAEQGRPRRKRRGRGAKRPPPRGAPRPAHGDRGAKRAARSTAPAGRSIDETVPTPPSSLDMDRRGSAARTGRAEHGRDAAGPSRHVGRHHRRRCRRRRRGRLLQRRRSARAATTPTPDQDIVDDIGKALGVEYQDNEELKGSDKVVERDRHRWELDPASSEDYQERKK